MKKVLLVVLTCLFTVTIKAQKTYVLIAKKTEKLNTQIITRLPVYLKAMAAFYGAMGGTNCMDEECELTTALGLGKQGSDAQKSLIEKYFPEDKAARLVLSQDCYLPPGSASTFSNFASLSFVVSGDSVRVDYQLNVFEHGTQKMIRGPDSYIYKNQVFKNVKRVLYAWTNK